MQSWNPYPFFRLIIPFVTGILIAIFLDFPVEPSRIALIVILVFLFLPVLALFQHGTWYNRWLFGVCVFLFLGMAGYAIVIFNSPKYDADNLSRFGGRATHYVVRITEPLTEKANSYKAVGEVVSAFDSVGSTDVSGNVLLYFEKDTVVHQVKYGDFLLLNTHFDEIKPPGNTHQFNYKRFLAHSGIYHQAYLKAGNWERSGKKKMNPVFQFAYEARFKLLKVLENNGLKGDEFAVVSAILLGYDDFMDRDLRQKYAGAGALHVLCVSGLHVGIIFLLLSFILKPLDKKRAFRYIKVVLILISIWAYAFITGLSPSVMRAAVMFSLFAVREASREKSNPYNILAASAFILLIIDPFMITKIGFQLSYSAVLAIVALFNPVYALLPVKNPILDYFWKLTVVSLAAQIGTFPLAIFYFHQFPVYFFLTNIIVIPLVWLILNTGILVLVVSLFSGMISSLLGLVLSIMLLVLNSSVGFINTLPGATVTGLVIGLAEVVMIYAVVILFNRSLISRSVSQLMVAACLLMLLSVSLLGRKMKIYSQNEFVIYQTNGLTGIDFIHHNKALFVADSALLADTQRMEFNISANRIFKGVRKVYNVEIDKIDEASDSFAAVPVKYYNPCFFSFRDKRVALIGQDHQMIKSEKPLPLDVLIMREKPRFSVRELQHQFSFKTVVFDPSMKHWQLRALKTYCDSTGQSYHDVGASGAFRLDAE